MIDLIKNYVIGALITALLSASGYGYYLYTQVDSKSKIISGLEDTIGEKDRLISSHRKSLDEATQLIGSLQQRFDELKLQEEKKAAEVAKALEESKKVTDSYEKSSARLLATIPKSSNMCLEADDLINSYLRNERASR